MLKQWKGELREHIPRQDLKDLFEYSSKKRDHLDFKRARKGSFLIVTHSMLPRLLDSATNWNTNLLDRTLLVVDEMHNVGSNRFRADEDEETVNLDNRESDFLRFGYRLGLSATPWSDHDYENVRNSFLVNSLHDILIPFQIFFANDDWIIELRRRSMSFISD